MRNRIGIFYFITNKNLIHKPICKTTKSTAYNNKQKFLNYKKRCKLTKKTLTSIYQEIEDGSIKDKKKTNNKISQIILICVLYCTKFEFSLAIKPYLIVL